MGCGVPWRAVVPWWRMAWRIAVEVACVVYTVELVLLERRDDAPLRALLVVGVHLLELQDRQRQVRRALAHGRKGIGAWAQGHGRMGLVALGLVASFGPVASVRRRIAPRRALHCAAACIGDLGWGGWRGRITCSSSLDT